MNLPELKNDFYKRLGPSDNFLYFTSNGLLCSLLGYDEIDGAPFLSCPLSMGIKMLSRRIGSNTVSIQDCHQSQAVSYALGANTSKYEGAEKETAELMERLKEKNIDGAEILFERSVPRFLSDKEILFTTITQAVMKSSGIEAEPLEIATASAGSENIAPYLGILYSRKGYCTFVSEGIPQNLPLPLSGYKILTAHCTEKDKERSKEIFYAFERLRRLYPHIGTIADITSEMVTDARPQIKNKRAAGYIYHLARENERISDASISLKRCNITGLFKQMNLSQQSMESLWDLGSEHIFLAHCCRETDGVEAVRCWKNGVVAIVSDDKTDHAMNMIKSQFENNIGYQPTFCVCDVF